MMYLEIADAIFDGEGNVDIVFPNGSTLLVDLEAWEMFQGFMTTDGWEEE